MRHIATYITPLEGVNFLLPFVLHVHTDIWTPFRRGLRGLNRAMRTNNSYTPVACITLISNWGLSPQPRAFPCRSAGRPFLPTEKMAVSPSGPLPWGLAPGGTPHLKRVTLKPRRNPNAKGSFLKSPSIRRCLGGRLGISFPDVTYMRKEE